jgi:hypothetical protein
VTWIVALSCSDVSFPVDQLQAALPVIASVNVVVTSMVI